MLKLEEIINNQILRIINNENNNLLEIYHVFNDELLT